MHDLVDALVDQSISDEQAAELNRRLEADQSARKEFMNLMRLEAELDAMHQPIEHVGSVASADSDVTPGDAERKREGVGRWVQFIAALAASVVLTAVGSSWLTLEGAGGRGPLAAFLDETPAEVEAPVVARVAATRNCRWRGASTDLGFGAGVAGGEQFELEAGLAELTFAGGARLVLEGPASFRVTDAETVEVFGGRVAAAVPEEAVGFSVRTPRLVVADAGSQYGVVVGSNGSDEVHVFEGDVQARAVDRYGRVTEVVSLAALEAVRYGRSSDHFARLNADDDGFVRVLHTRNGPGEGLLGFENFAYGVGPVAWQNGGFGWAGPWADLEAAPAGDTDAELTNAVARGSMSAHGMVALGNRFIQRGTGNRVRRTLSTSIGGVFDAAGLVENNDGLRLIGRDGSTVYLSFLQRVSKLDEVFYGFELHRGDGNFNRVLCIGSGVDEHGYGVTSTFQEVDIARYEPLEDENTEVNFFVLRIDFGENGAQDKATVYRNPRSMDDESQCEVSATMFGTFAFDRVSLGNFNGEKTHEVDEIRIGTNFRAVTGKPATQSSGFVLHNKRSDDKLRPAALLSRRGARIQRS